MRLRVLSADSPTRGHPTAQKNARRGHRVLGAKSPHNGSGGCAAGGAAPSAATHSPTVIQLIQSTRHLYQLNQ
jgi:hypothetical protein